MAFMKTALLLASTASLLSALSLQESIDLALENNHELRSSAMQRGLSKAAVKERRSERYGKVDAVAAYTHHNTPRTLYPLTPASVASGAGGVATTQDLFSAGLRYDVLLFDGFAQEEHVAIAKLQEEVALMRYKLGREALIHTVRNVYADALAARAGKGAWQQYAGAMEALYTAIRQEVEAGRKAPIELLKVEAERLKGQTQAAQYRTRYDTFVSLLRLLIGDTRPIDTIDEIAFDPDETEPRPQHDPARLRLAALEVEKAKKGLRQARSGALPHVGFESYYGSSFGPNDTSHPDSGTWEHQEIWSVGLNLRWNLADFGENDARQQQAHLALMQQVQNERDAALRYAHQAREATLNLEYARQAYLLARKNRVLMEETEKIETLRYREGQSSINDLLEQQAKTQLARSEELTARYAVIKRMYDLEYLYEEGDTP